MKKNKLVLLFSVLVLSCGVFAAPGDPDASFGSGGKVFIESPDSVEFINSGVIVQPDGKILAASNRFSNSSVLLVVVRLNPNGTLDSAFGDGGIFQTSFGGVLSAATCLALQSDGKIVVGGVANIGFSEDGNFALARINPNGTLDATFGTNGKVMTAFAAGYSEIAQDLAIQPDGKIVAVGTSQSDSEQRSFFAAARYNLNGSLDDTFDADGKLIVAASNRPKNEGFAAAVDDHGKILIGGGCEELFVAESEFALVRLNADGSFDASFDGDGKVQISVAGQSEYIHKLKIQTDGKIVAAGHSDVDPVGSGDDDFALVRLNESGTLDATFSGDGKLTFAFDAENDFEQVWGIDIQRNGKIIAAGVSGKVDPANKVPILEANFAVARFDSNGAIDSGFGTNGGVITRFSTPVNLGFDAVLQPDGKIIQVGYSGDTDYETLNSKIALVRYHGDETAQMRAKPIFDFDGDSKTDVSIFRPSGGEWWLRKSSNGETFAAHFGTSSDTIVPADYTGDGKTDQAFFRPSDGFWFVLRSEDNSFYGFPFGIGSDTPVPADFDGDGKADAAVLRSSTMTWFIQKSSGGVDIFNFGLTGDKPVAADYDGDGKADAAIFRPQNGQWWIRRSSGGDVFAVQFGTETDKPIPGDFTGDGKDDIAFFRSSTGQWFVLRSEDFSFYAFPFGSVGEVPAAGDYDGDGRTDAAVFRPSNSAWFIQKSSGGTSIQSFGTSGDLPVPSAFVR